MKFNNVQIGKMYQQNSSKEGYIFDIQRYCIHDGPGIRTIIFLKGCPLRCLWCCNPEGQRTEFDILFFGSRCQKCNICVDNCKNNAISSINGFKTIDYKLCTSCYECVINCPGNALKVAGKKISVERLFSEIKKDMIFYKRSGGGITLSGGEPTFQPEFAKAILQHCKSYGIHTAIQTCGYQKWKFIHMLLEYTDLAMVDIKHMNDKKHKKLTGFSNRLILENIKKISEHKNVLLKLRIPIIPQYNDSFDNIKNFIQFAKSLSKLGGIELIPYHRIGYSKYKSLSRQYFNKFMTRPEEKKISKIERYISEHGIEVQIGG